MSELDDFMQSVTGGDPAPSNNVTAPLGSKCDDMLQFNLANPTATQLTIGAYRSIVTVNISFNDGQPEKHQLMPSPTPPLIVDIPANTTSVHVDVDVNQIVDPTMSMLVFAW